MSFDWEEFAELAAWLPGQRADEASQRTAISRAYYAAYHAASTFIRRHALYASHLQLSHRLVWLLIRQSGGPHSAEVANLGNDLKAARVWADYRDSFADDLPGDVEKALANAAAIIALLRETETGPSDPGPG